MIIHVAGAIRDYELDTAVFRTIVQNIHDSGSTIALDWIEPAIMQPGNLQAYIDLEESLSAIKRADIVIVESNYYTFNEGYQVAAALNQKKPTLVLSRVPVNDKLLSGMNDPLLCVRTYNNDTLGEVVRKFIKHNTISTKDLRFNFFIDREIYNYLEEASFESGKNKSEIIREVIMHKIYRDKSS